MGKQKAPKAPDPRETASAQTSTNIGTAIANGYLGNVNQVTPDGNLTYSQSGTNKWKDPMSGAVYDLPTWTATQTLSPAQQAIKEQNNAAELNLSKLANSQSGRLQDLLGKPFNLDGAPAAGDPSKVGLPQYGQYGPGPNLQTSLGNAGNVQSSIADAGNIQKSLGNAGDITKTYDYSADTSRYENALMERMNPQLERSRAALETQLANQGLQPGSEAFNRAIDSATRQENDARFGAILNAGQEQSRLAGLARDQAGFQNNAQQQAYNQMLSSGQFANTAQQQQFGQNQAQLQANNTSQQQKFDQGLASATFGNSANQQMYQNNQTQTAANNALKDQTFNAQQAQLAAQNQARSQYLNEQYALRNQPINEISSLLSGAQVSNPNFVPTQGQSIPNVDYAGLVNQDYQNRLGAYQQKQAGIGSVLGGLAGMFTLSDKTAKKDIEKVGELKGHGLYEYSYRGKHNDGRRHIGVMAQDVEKKRPDAVRKGSDGLRRVDYGALFAAGRKK